MNAVLSENFSVQARGRDSSALKKDLFAFILDSWNETASIFPELFDGDVMMFDRQMTLDEFCARRDKGDSKSEQEAFHAIGTTYNKAVGLIEMWEVLPKALYIELPRLIKLLRRPVDPYDDEAVHPSVAFLDYLFWQSLKFLSRHPGFERVPVEDAMACEGFLTQEMRVRGWVFDKNMESLGGDVYNLREVCLDVS